MNGAEFIRRGRRLGRKRDIAVTLESARGKGGHRTLRFGDRLTVVKSGEIGKGLLRAMCRQLDIDPDEI